MASYKHLNAILSSCFILGISGLSKANENFQVQELSERMNQLEEKLTQSKSNSLGFNQIVGSETRIKLYGNIRVDMAYDLDASTNSVNNKTGNLPLENSDPTEKALNVSVAASRIGLDITRSTEYGDFLGKFEADFWGEGTSNNDGRLRIRQAYGSIGNWLIGQTASPFVNIDTSPELIDFTGSMGGGTQRNVQIRYSKLLNNKNNIMVALEGGDVDNFTGKDQTSGGSMYPALTTRFDVNLTDLSTLIQLHGMVHNNRVSLNNSLKEDKWGWGIGIGAKVQLSTKDSITANYYHVEGDSRYLHYANQNNVAFNVTNVVNEDQETIGFLINPNKYHTYQLGYQHKWMPHFRSNISFAAMKFNDNQGYAKAQYNEDLKNIIFNTIYSPVKNIDLGAEYTYGERQTFGNAEGKMSRINLLTRYHF